MLSGLLKVLTGVALLALVALLLLAAFAASERGDFRVRAWEIPVAEGEGGAAVPALPGTLRVAALDAAGLSGVRGLPAGTDAAARAAVQAFGRRLVLTRADVVVLFDWPMQDPGLPDPGAYRALAATLGLPHAHFLPLQSRRFAAAGWPGALQRFGTIERGLLVLSRHPLEVEEQASERPRSGPPLHRVYGPRDGLLCLLVAVEPELRRSLCILAGLRSEDAQLPESAQAERRITVLHPERMACADADSAPCIAHQSDDGGPALHARGVEALQASTSNTLDDQLPAPLLLVEVRYLDIRDAETNP